MDFIKYSHIQTIQCITAKALFSAEANDEDGASSRYSESFFSMSE